MFLVTIEVFKCGRQVHILVTQKLQQSSFPIIVSDNNSVKI
jgi:hypothetical protein